MSKFDFSVLVSDLVSGEYSTCGENGEMITGKDLQNHLRDTINKDVFGGLNMRQALRRNKNTVYEVVEEIVDIVVGENILKSDFIDQFVEYKNRELGDRTEWYTEGDTLLTVAHFAGNHWDTNRQSFDLGSKFTLGHKWAFIHVYTEFERFLLGIDSFDKLTNAITKSYETFINEQIFLQFQGVSSAVPAEFSGQGNSEDDVLRLCEKVQTFGGYNDLIIAGTQTALRKLDNVVPAAMVAESQKQSRAMTGSFGIWNGINLMRIPQAKLNDSFELALDNNKLFILGGDTKPIKFEWIGDTRAKIVDDEHVNNDMTLDIQVQTAYGIGMLLPKYFGVYTFA